MTSDLALSIGYKLNDKSILGVGASYKIGWGKDLQHIKISHQGLGFRGFIDVKLKRSLWITGGYELNYFAILNNSGEFDAWRRSGLLGLSKTISTKSKFFKKTKLQLLWDFLSYEQQPRSQPIVYRIGYNL